MAWTTPRTHVTGEITTAAILNVHLRDNLDHLYGDIATFSPTVTQSGSVTLTTAVGRYRHVGNTCWLHIFCDSGGTGTGGNAITIGAVPAAIAARVTGTFGSAGELDVGTGYYFDSGTALYRCLSIFNAAATMLLYDSGATVANSAMGVSPATAVATADSLGATITYETASAS